MLPKLFYIIQIVYVVVAWLLFFEAVFIFPQTLKIEHRKVFYSHKIDSLYFFGHGQWSC